MAIELSYMLECLNEIQFENEIKEMFKINKQMCVHIFEFSRCTAPLFQISNLCIIFFLQINNFSEINRRFHIFFLGTKIALVLYTTW